MNLWDLCEEISILFHYPNIFKLQCMMGNRNVKFCNLSLCDGICMLHTMHVLPTSCHGLKILRFRLQSFSSYWVLIIPVQITLQLMAYRVKKGHHVIIVGQAGWNVSWNNAASWWSSDWKVSHMWDKEFSSRADAPCVYVAATDSEPWVHDRSGTELSRPKTYKKMVTKWGVHFNIVTLYH